MLHSRSQALSRFELSSTLAQEHINWTNIKGRCPGLQALHWICTYAIFVSERLSSVPFLVKCWFDWNFKHAESVPWFNATTAHDEHPGTASIMIYDLYDKGLRFCPQVHCFWNISLLYPTKVSDRMTTVTGYPLSISADELDSVYVVLQAFQTYQQIRGGCNQCWESSVNLHILQWQLQCF